MAIGAAALAALGGTAAFAGPATAAGITLQKGTVVTPPPAQVINQPVINQNLPPSFQNFLNCLAANSSNQLSGLSCFSLLGLNLSGVGQGAGPLPVAPVTLVKGVHVNIP